MEEERKRIEEEEAEKKRMEEEVKIRLICEVDSYSVLLVSSIDYSILGILHS